ncbi:hypothetical protein CEXT_436091 [Caerostris extrusa]|uniref:Uncharacterized protein n=1 Tax=Caerostris extrusa TaxID=172846 RepID=A0AAV4MNF6_CAEEX|nr:hypothetical protein CEXT_436091 [Caerostris extrusa]
MNAPEEKKSSVVGFSPGSTFSLAKDAVKSQCPYFHFTSLHRFTCTPTFPTDHDSYPPYSSHALHLCVCVRTSCDPHCFVLHCGSPGFITGWTALGVSALRATEGLDGGAC